jgi:3-deoxy-7-phosphoheptulonate synthase
MLLLEKYNERDLLNPACIVDANHNNSNKQYKEQIRIVHEVMSSRRHNSDIAGLVKGVMVESYIKEGCQKIGERIYGKSITDPCLGWKDTEDLIYRIADYV